MARTDYAYANYYHERFSDPQRGVMSFRSGGITMEIALDRYDGIENRFTYMYRVFGPTGPLNEPIVHGDDLRSGCGEDLNLPLMMASLITFLEAWQESTRRDSHNFSLFDVDMRDALDWDQFLMDAREHLSNIVKERV